MEDYLFFGSFRTSPSFLFLLAQSGEEDIQRLLLHLHLLLFHQMEMNPSFQLMRQANWAHIRLF